MQHAFNKHQQGFTLLELLVVITLLAVLSVGALVAYEGVGDSASATAQANNTVSTDRAIRNFRAITGGYPTQWDVLSVQADGSALAALADDTKTAFGDVLVDGTNTAQAAIFASLEDAGIKDLQFVVSQGTVQPNLMHNEGANPTVPAAATLATATGGAVEDDLDQAVHLSFVPAGTGCTAGGKSIATAYGVAGFIQPTLVQASANLNKINDSLSSGLCHLVVALGFGHDAAHSTFDSSVAIASAPTFTSKNINPANNYARYLGLFHVGTATSGTDVGAVATDIKAVARLIAVVGADGKAIDEALAAATAAQ